AAGKAADCTRLAARCAQPSLDSRPPIDYPSSSHWEDASIHSQGRPMIARDRMFSPVRRTAIALVGMLLCALLCVLAHGQTQAGKVLVEDIIPQGNRLVPTQKIISLLKTRPGTEFSQETVSEDVRRLYETKQFANIEVRTQPVAGNKVKVYIL